ncbi:MAG: hypothetical protein WC462_01390 [archaeon]
MKQKKINMHINSLRTTIAREIRLKRIKEGRKAALELLKKRKRGLNILEKELGNSRS